MAERDPGRAAGMRPWWRPARPLSTSDGSGFPARVSPEDRAPELEKLARCLPTTSLVC